MSKNCYNPVNVSWLSDDCIYTTGGVVKPRTENQKRYLRAMLDRDVVFALGPAGTGKTFLAVAFALACLHVSRMDKVLFVRPLLNAGENLGYLPGDIQEKVNPYLQPLYDALRVICGSHDVYQHCVQHKQFEVAPLAYMRGRNINNSLVIFDEAQNATVEQTKMLLTRIGEGTQVILAGDPKQVDLPRGVQSGLMHAVNLLQELPSVEAINFNVNDIMRSDLVAKIVQAYENSSVTREKYGNTQNKGN